MRGPIPTILSTLDRRPISGKSFLGRIVYVGVVERLAVTYSIEHRIRGQVVGVLEDLDDLVCNSVRQSDDNINIAGHSRRRIVVHSYRASQHVIKASRLEPRNDIR